LLAIQVQKVSGFLARSGEEEQAFLAWRQHVSPGDIRPRFGAQPSNLALATPKIHPNPLIDP
ncbi:hypothetical protein A2U01_0087812, partial [Trifolium medium]|nr:hypothetical protein [Trifolium medium]